MGNLKRMRTVRERKQVLADGSELIQKCIRLSAASSSNIVAICALGAATVVLGKSKQKLDETPEKPFFVCGLRRIHDCSESWLDLNTRI